MSYHSVMELRHLRYFVAVAEELHFGRAAERLHEGFLQAGFVRLPFSDENLVLRTVLREPVVAVLPDGHPLVAEDSIALETLANEPFILIPRHREPGLYDHYISLCRQAGFSPRVVQEVHRIHTTVGLVAAGIGVSFAPASTKNLQRSGVAYRPREDPSPTLEMAVARRREEPSPVLRAFLETDDEIFAERPDLDSARHRIR